MAADNTFVRQQFVAKMQAACKLVTQLDSLISQLDSLYQGAALASTFVDGELAVNNVTKHLVAADIATAKAQLNTIQTAMTTNIRQNMAKVLGDLPV